MKLNLIIQVPARMTSSPIQINGKLFQYYCLVLLFMHTDTAWGARLRGTIPDPDKQKGSFQN